MILPTTIEPSLPAFSAIWRIGASRAFKTMLIPACSSAFSLLSLETAILARSSATPPPGTMPSSTAARVALSASSTRSFFSLTSTSVAPPTRIPPTPAASLPQPLLQFLLVVVGGRLFDLRLDLGDAAFDVLLGADAVDDRGVLLLDADALSLAEHLHRDVLELDAEVLGDHGAAGQDRDVVEHRLAAIAETCRLDRCGLEAAAQLVDHQCRQRLAFDVLGNNDQRLAGLHHRLQGGEHRLPRGE